jgi:uncharacterized cupredoxin-like copper-binding protein
MRKLAVHFVLVGAALAAILALGPAASAAPTRGSHHTATTIQVTGGEFWFKLSTKTLTKPGPVTFAFKNVGKLPHDFKILEKATTVISPGQSSSITVQFTKPGRFPYACTVPGHAAGGMKGVFTVR